MIPALENASQELVQKYSIASLIAHAVSTGPHFDSAAITTIENIRPIVHSLPPYAQNALAIMLSKIPFSGRIGSFLHDLPSQHVPIETPIDAEYRTAFELYAEASWLHTDPYVFLLTLVQSPPHAMLTSPTEAPATLKTVPVRLKLAAMSRILDYAGPPPQNMEHVVKASVTFIFGLLRVTAKARSCIPTATDILSKLCYSPQARRKIIALALARMFPQVDSIEPRPVDLLLAASALRAIVTRDEMHMVTDHLLAPSDHYWIDEMSRTAPKILAETIDCFISLPRPLLPGQPTTQATLATPLALVVQARWGQTAPSIGTDNVSNLCQEMALAVALADALGGHTQQLLDLLTAMSNLHGFPGLGGSVPCRRAEAGPGGRANCVGAVISWGGAGLGGSGVMWNVSARLCFELLAMAGQSNDEREKIQLEAAANNLLVAKPDTGGSLESDQGMAIALEIVSMHHVPDFVVKTVVDRAVAGLQSGRASPELSASLARFIIREHWNAVETVKIRQVFGLESQIHPPSFWYNPDLLTPHREQLIASLSLLQPIQTTTMLPAVAILCSRVAMDQATASESEGGPTDEDNSTTAVWKPLVDVLADADFILPAAVAGVLLAVVDVPFVNPPAAPREGLVLQAMGSVHRAVVGLHCALAGNEADRIWAAHAVAKMVHRSLESSLETSQTISESFFEPVPNLPLPLVSDSPIYQGSAHDLYLNVLLATPALGAVHLLHVVTDPDAVEALYTAVGFPADRFLRDLVALSFAIMFTDQFQYLITTSSPIQWTIPDPTPDSVTTMLDNLCNWARPIISGDWAPTTVASLILPATYSLGESKRILDLRACLVDLIPDPGFYMVGYSDLYKLAADSESGHTIQDITPICQIVPDLLLQAEIHLSSLPPRHASPLLCAIPPSPSDDSPTPTLFRAGRYMRLLLTLSQSLPDAVTPWLNKLLGIVEVACHQPPLAQLGQTLHLSLIDSLSGKFKSNDSLPLEEMLANPDYCRLLTALGLNLVLPTPTRSNAVSLVRFTHPKYHGQINTGSDIDAHAFVQHLVRELRRMPDPLKLVTLTCLAELLVTPQWVKALSRTTSAAARMGGIPASPGAILMAPESNDCVRLLVTELGSISAAALRPVASKCLACLGPIPPAPQPRFVPDFARTRLSDRTVALVAYLIANPLTDLFTAGNDDPELRFLTQELVSTSPSACPEILAPFKVSRFVVTDEGPLLESGQRDLLSMPAGLWALDVLADNGVGLAPAELITRPALRQLGSNEAMLPVIQPMLLCQTSMIHTLGERAEHFDSLFKDLDAVLVPHHGRPSHVTQLAIDTLLALEEVTEPPPPINRNRLRTRRRAPISPARLAEACFANNKLSDAFRLLVMSSGQHSNLFIPGPEPGGLDDESMLEEETETLTQSLDTHALAVRISEALDRVDTRPFMTALETWEPLVEAGHTAPLSGPLSFVSDLHKALYPDSPASVLDFVNISQSPLALSVHEELAELQKALGYSSSANDGGRSTSLTLAELEDVWAARAAIVGRHSAVNHAMLARSRVAMVSRIVDQSECLKSELFTHIVTSASKSLHVLGLEREAYDLCCLSTVQQDPPLLFQMAMSAPIQDRAELLSALIDNPATVTSLKAKAALKLAQLSTSRQNSYSTTNADFKRASSYCEVGGDPAQLGLVCFCHACACQDHLHEICRTIKSEIEQKQLSSHEKWSGRLRSLRDDASAQFSTAVQQFIKAATLHEPIALQSISRMILTLSETLDIKTFGLTNEALWIPQGRVSTVTSSISVAPHLLLRTMAPLIGLLGNTCYNRMLCDCACRLMAEVGLKFPQQVAWAIHGTLHSKAPPGARSEIAIRQATACSNAEGVIRRLISAGGRDSGAVQAHITAVTGLIQKITGFQSSRAMNKSSRPHVDHRLMLHNRIQPGQVPILVPSFTAMYPSGTVHELVQHDDLLLFPCVSRLKFSGVQSMQSLRAPITLPFEAHDGSVVTFLAKTRDDLRIDSRICVLMDVINDCLKSSRPPSLAGRHVVFNPYFVCHFGDQAVQVDAHRYEKGGLIEFMRGCVQLREAIAEGFEYAPYGPGGLRVKQNAFMALCKSNFLSSRDGHAKEESKRVANFKALTTPPGECAPAFRHFFLHNFLSGTSFVEAVWAFTRTIAIWSVLGWIMGLGDRHVENILLNRDSGAAWHIDFDCCFNRAVMLAVPETVPFRMTPNIVDAMGPGGLTRVSRSMADFVRLLQKYRERVVNMLRTFQDDPAWSTNLRGAVDAAVDRLDCRDPDTRCRELINVARDPVNLTLMFQGWQPIL
ncbi:serine/threonine-protein kinase ATR [Carpediemonas membranifera]|uniref:Serine/threonine-protein kinase ATR n=1 Tax=Carpediemonas membranifera TaxID=201153 RepID=A0A8J6APH0_9EUKA|nr:serine/threonine-protein kinase ATR [Carpediemonas membranifera]|eukprot:KAG9389488.1 serine/threonine-protein kinase ATR [Carpediemonas membranifera]